MYYYKTAVDAVGSVISHHFYQISLLKLRL